MHPAMVGQLLGVRPPTLGAGNSVSQILWVCRDYRVRMPGCSVLAESGGHGANILASWKLQMRASQGFDLSNSNLQK